MTTPENGPWGDRPLSQSDMTLPASAEQTQRVGGDAEATQWIPPEQQQTEVWQPQDQSWEEQQRAVPPADELAPVGKHVLIALAVVLVVALLGVATYFTVRHNSSPPVAAPQPSSPQAPPVPTFTDDPDTTTSSTTTTTTSDSADPRAALATAPLSSAAATMGSASCALPKFDLPDAKQAQFFQAAKVCADSAWGATLPSADIPAASVRLVVVQGAAADTPCGSIGPGDPSTQCQGTVYMTPAYLRDVQANGRYPGKYFGTFLREYGHALQDVSGLTAMYKDARSQPGANPDDLDRRYNDQAICLAGIASGAMSGKGAVDGNITNEIRERITTADAPADAATWLNKGFTTKQLSACNTWKD
jgi:hypothetical protein